MKKTAFIILLICHIFNLDGQVSKTINISAGSLISSLTRSELSTITDLTVTGTIDSRDIRILKDSMPALAVLDLSGSRILAYSGTEGVSYPNQEDYSSDVLPYNSFVTKHTLKRISLPSTLLSIGAQAFWYCQSLENITLPATLQKIDFSAFEGCSKASDITIPASVTSIGANSFSSFSGLINVAAANSFYSSVAGVLFNKNKTLLVQSPTSIEGTYNIPSSVRVIGYGAFGYCTKIQTLTIPGSVSNIEGSAFSYCSSLNSVTIPSSVINIGESAFLGCTSLNSLMALLETPIDLSSSTQIFQGVPFSSCTLTVPYGSSSLYSTASQWKDFTHVTELPPFRISTTKLFFTENGGTSSFGITTGLGWNCQTNEPWINLSPPTGNGDSQVSVTVQPNGLLSERTGMVTITGTGLPSYYITIEQKGIPRQLNVTAGGLKSSLTTGELSEVSNLVLTGTIDARDVKTMRDDMPVLKFLDLSGTRVISYTGSEGTSDEFGVYLENVFPGYAFSRRLTGNTSLVSIKLPSGLTELGYGAFYNCTGLEKISIPSTVMRIRTAALNGCEKLDSLSLPPSLKIIEEAAFANCISLVSINIPNGVQAIYRIAFDGCTKLNDLFIPASVVFIENQIFPGNYNVSELNIYYSSNDGILFNKKQTTLIDYPVNKPGAYVIPSTVTDLLGNAFYNCKNLTSVKIPITVDTLSYGVFWGCTGLASITLPSSIKYCEISAFWGCTGLRSVYSQSSIPPVMSDWLSGKVFQNVDLSLCVLHVPVGTASLYSGDEQWKEFSSIVEMPSFSLSANYFLFPEKGDTVIVTINSSVPWSAISDQTWLKVIPQNGNGNGQITLSSLQNPLLCARDATVTVSAPGTGEYTIVISQSPFTGLKIVSAGNLAVSLTPEELKMTETLNLTGTIDARDFKTMRDRMPMLKNIDIINATIVEYSGTEGPVPVNYTYRGGYVPWYAFYNPEIQIGKETLCSVKLPVSAIVVDTYAFYSCYQLASVEFPADLIAVGYYSFCSCVSLTEVLLGGKVQIISDLAFTNTPALFNVNSTNQFFSTLDGVLFNKDQTTLIQFPISRTGTYSLPGNVETIGITAFLNSSLSSVSMVNSKLTIIGKEAFAYCSQMLALTIPASVDSIGSFAFYGCQNLRYLNSYLPVPLDLSVSVGVFDGINKTTCRLTVPFGSKPAYSVADQWKDFLNIVEEMGITFSTDSLIIPASGGQTSFEISSNVNWTLVPNKSWLTVNPSSGNGINQVVTVTVQPNTNTGTRSSILTLTNQYSGVKYFIMVIQESPIPVIRKVVANYPLLNNANDISGNYGPMTLINTPFGNGGIICNGIYRLNTGGSDAFTPNLSLDKNTLQIDVDFNISEYFNGPVICCGTSSRWLGIAFDYSGFIGLCYNNNFSVFSNTKCTLNEWHSARIAYDGTDLSLFLDNKMVVTLAVVLNYVPNDTYTGITNWASGRVFKGVLRNLVFSKEVENTTTGIDYRKELSVGIYPNPASDYLQINLEDYPYWNEGHLKITNLAGTLAHEEYIKSSLITLNCLKWPGKGIYLLEVSGKDGRHRIIKKVIVQ